MCRYLRGDLASMWEGSTASQRQAQGLPHSIPGDASGGRGALGEDVDVEGGTEQEDEERCLLPPPGQGL